MAKFSRLGPVWRKPKPNHWKKQKNLARWANERQMYEESIEFSTPIEIVTVDGSYGFITEQSSDANPVYFATEGS